MIETQLCSLRSDSWPSALHRFEIDQVAGTGMIS